MPRPHHSFRVTDELGQLQRLAPGHDVVSSSRSRDWLILGLGPDPKALAESLPPEPGSAMWNARPCGSRWTRTGTRPSRPTGSASKPSTPWPRKTSCFPEPAGGFSPASGRPSWPPCSCPARRPRGIRSGHGPARRKHGQHPGPGRTSGLSGRKSGRAQPGAGRSARLPRTDPAGAGAQPQFRRPRPLRRSPGPARPGRSAGGGLVPGQPVSRTRGRAQRGLAHAAPLCHRCLVRGAARPPRRPPGPGPAPGRRPAFFRGRARPPGAGAVPTLCRPQRHSGQGARLFRPALAPGTRNRGAGHARTRGTPGFRLVGGNGWAATRSGRDGTPGAWALAPKL